MAPKNKCGCSEDCMATTGGKFAPGHDARMISLLVTEVKYGDVELEEARAMIRKVGGSESLVTKLDRAIGKLPMRFEWIGETALVDLSWQFTVHYRPNPESPAYPWEVTCRQDELVYCPHRWEHHRQAINWVFGLLSRQGETRQRILDEYDRVARQGGKISIRAY